MSKILVPESLVLSACFDLVGRTSDVLNGTNFQLIGTFITFLLEGTTFEVPGRKRQFLISYDKVSPK